MAKAKKAEVAEDIIETPVIEMSEKKIELTKRLYALADDPEKVEEFEAVRLELEALG